MKVEEEDYVRQRKSYNQPACRSSSEDKERGERGGGYQERCTIDSLQDFSRTFIYDSILLSNRDPAQWWWGRFESTRRGTRTYLPTYKG